MKEFRLNMEDGMIMDIYDVEEVDGELKKLPGRFLIPKEVTAISSEALVEFDPDEIDVEEGNSVFYAKDNCLITKADNVLCLACSNSKIPDDGSISAIGACAFNGIWDFSGMNLNPFGIPNSVKEIRYRAFAGISDKPVSIIVPEKVDSVACMAFMINSDKAPVRIVFEGDPDLEVGVFGTEAEAMDSANDLYKQLPSIVYSNPDIILVYGKAGTSVEAYCKKYKIPFETITWNTYIDLLKNITGNQDYTTDAPLYSLFSVDPQKYSDISYSELNLTYRAFVCINHYFNHPFSTCEPGFQLRDSVSELLKLSVDDYKKMLNLGGNAFFEIMVKIARLISDN